MRRALASVLGGYQSLSSSDVCERPVDRLAAAGVMARQAGKADEALRAAVLCSLGVDLIAFKYGHRGTSWQDAIDQLAAALRWPHLKLHLRARQYRPVAAWAVQEWAVDICPVCQGAGTVPDHDHKGLEGKQPMKPCVECEASGKRRYDDSERLRALGGQFEDALSAAHMLIGWAEGLALAHGKKLLERA